jgi:hypothetical protein
MRLFSSNPPEDLLMELCFLIVSDLLSIPPVASTRSLATPQASITFRIFGGEVLASKRRN